MYICWYINCLLYVNSFSLISNMSIIKINITLRLCGLNVLDLNPIITVKILLSNQCICFIILTWYVWYINLNCSIHYNMWYCSNTSAGDEVYIITTNAIVSLYTKLYTFRYVYSYSLIYHMPQGTSFISQPVTQKVYLTMYRITCKQCYVISAILSLMS